MIGEFLSFQIVGPATYQPLEEFQRLVQSMLQGVALHGPGFQGPGSQGNGLTAVETEDGLTHLISSDRPVANLALESYDDVDEDGKEKRPILIRFRVLRTDRNVAQFLRSVLARAFKGYALFSEQWECRLPSDQNILSFEINPLDNDLDTLTRDRGFTPRFIFLPTQALYADAEDGEVHLLNSSLLAYMVRRRTTKHLVGSEFSYPVAPDLSRFALFFNRGLVPVHFYEHWQRPLKIINHSFMPLENVPRRLLLTLSIYEFEGDAVPRYSSNLESPLVNVLDVLEVGGNLDSIIKKVLVSVLGLAEDFERALVAREVGFEEDAEGGVVPRIQVNVFVSQILDRALVEDLRRGIKPRIDVDKLN